MVVMVMMIIMDVIVYNGDGDGGDGGTLPPKVDDEGVVKHLGSSLSSFPIIGYILEKSGQGFLGSCSCVLRVAPCSLSSCSCFCSSCTVSAPTILLT